MDNLVGWVQRTERILGYRIESITVVYETLPIAIGGAAANRSASAGVLSIRYAPSAIVGFVSGNHAHV